MKIRIVPARSKIPRNKKKTSRARAVQDPPAHAPPYHADSMASVAPKAQHEPHWPWFLTWVTAPWERQSKLVTLEATGVGMLTMPAMRSSGEAGLRLSILPLNSATDQSENLLTPKTAVPCLAMCSLFCCAMRASDALKLPNRSSSSATLSYFLPNISLNERNSCSCWNCVRTSSSCTGIVVVVVVVVVDAPSSAMALTGTASVVMHAAAASAAAAVAKMSFMVAVLGLGG